MKNLIISIFLIYSCHIHTSSDFKQYYPGILENSHFNLNYKTENLRQNYNIIINDDNLTHYNPTYPLKPLLLSKGNYINEADIGRYFKKTSIVNTLSNTKFIEFYTFEYNFENNHEENFLLNLLTLLSLAVIPNSTDLKYTLKTKFLINGTVKKEYSVTKTVNFFGWILLIPYGYLSEPYRIKENYIFYSLIKETNESIERDFFL
ncbi:hypothetical protein EHQ23_16975 [Leptospira bourretii]|uniref:Uncharacterized protein n=1 Tax=Leptospira bourretii TaxID=2484962 RepID=A0A4V3JL15_9LEPT|nr:hypothetical protein [Leptospira bourretii]TGK79303.1 hypothetical protein EHQ23_16975 [Leptospira bourretii]TGK89509.1 hypothetical protein EHQ26_13825 [Leptospira bourretii]